MRNSILVSNDNIEAMLKPIVQNMYSKINALVLSDTDKAKLTILNYIITNGLGTKFLADDGTYQTYVPTGYRELTTDELTALTTDIKLAFI